MPATMRYVNLPGTSLSASAICLGTADWGTREGDAVEQVYSTYREGGGNCFDTAHCYAFWAGAEGKSETMLGQMIRQHDKREDVIVCSKGCHISAGPDYPRPERYMTPELLNSDLQDSLNRLEMDYIDLYYLHRDDPQVPVNEIMDALHEHQEAGRIRYYAASNWRGERLQQARDYAQQQGYQPFAASQILWNLGHLSNPMPPDICVMDDAELLWYEESRLPVFAFSATANGYFGDKPSQASYDNEISAKRRERAVQLARQYNATPNQVALAYLMSHSFPGIALIGTINLEHLRDALGAAPLQLAPQELNSLTGK